MQNMHHYLGNIPTMQYPPTGPIGAQFSTVGPTGFFPYGLGFGQAPASNMISEGMRSTYPTFNPLNIMPPNVNYEKDTGRSGPVIPIFQGRPLQAPVPVASYGYPTNSRASRAAKGRAAVSTTTNANVSTSNGAPYSNNFQNNARNNNNFQHNHHGGNSYRKKRPQKGLEDNVKRTVYISYVDYQISEEQLASFFNSCGKVSDCRICGDPNSALRFAFIEFLSIDGAQRALEKNGIVFGSSPLRVVPSKTAIVPVNREFMPRTNDDVERCSRTVYAANIDKLVDRNDVKSFFESLCGKVTKIRLLGDYQHTTCIAFVEFDQAEAALAALNCSGALLGSLPIRVSPSKTPVRAEVKENGGNAAAANAPAAGVIGLEGPVDLNPDSGHGGHHDENPNDVVQDSGEREGNLEDRIGGSSGPNVTSSSPSHFPFPSDDEGSKHKLSDSLAEGSGSRAQRGGGTGRDIGTERDPEREEAPLLLSNVASPSLSDERNGFSVSPKKAYEAFYNPGDEALETTSREARGGGVEEQQQYQQQQHQHKQYQQHELFIQQQQHSQQQRQHSHYQQQQQIQYKQQSQQSQQQQQQHSYNQQLQNYSHSTNTNHYQHHLSQLQGSNGMGSEYMQPHHGMYRNSISNAFTGEAVTASYNRVRNSNNNNRA